MADFVKKAWKIISELYEKGKKGRLATDKQFGSKKDLLLTIGLISVTAIIIMLIWLRHIRNKPQDFIIVYVLLILFSFVLLVIVTYFYVYGKRSRLHWIEQAFTFLYVGMHMIFFAVMLPGLFLLRLIDIILNSKETRRNRDSLEKWMKILAIELITVFLILGFFNIWFVERISGVIVSFFSEYGRDIRLIPLQLFLLLGTFKLEMDLIEYIILRISKKRELIKIEKEKSQKEEDYKSSFVPGEDIREFSDKKNRYIKKWEDEQRNNIEDDLNYQQQSLWKCQLICLMFIFADITFSPGKLYKYQGDIVNVVTWFTLLMLYLDKRREWSKNRRNQ